MGRRLPLATLLRAIEWPLIVSGIALLGVYAVARVQGNVASAQALRSFAVAQEAAQLIAPAARAGNGAPEQRAAPSQPPLTLAAGDAPDQSLWGPTRIAAYRASLETELGTPLAVLTIPRIDVKVPIFEGTSDLTLNRGAGRIEGTAAIDERGNLGIAGHRDGFFRGLKDIAVGDAIEVQSLTGLVSYEVTEILIVDPTDVYVLDPTDTATLTLVTCYPFYFIGSAPQRYIVKAAAL